MSAVSCSGEGGRADHEEPSTICCFWSTWKQPQSHLYFGPLQWLSRPPLLCRHPCHFCKPPGTSPLIQLTNPGKAAGCSRRASKLDELREGSTTSALWRGGSILWPGGQVERRQLPPLLPASCWIRWALTDTPARAAPVRKVARFSSAGEAASVGLQPIPSWESVKRCLCLLAPLISANIRGW